MLIVNIRDKQYAIGIACLILIDTPDKIRTCVVIRLITERPCITFPRFYAGANRRRVLEVIKMLESTIVELLLLEKL